MRKIFIVAILLWGASMMQAAPSPAPSAWRAKVAETMPLLGHRNWILIVDSAYPLQTSPGVETIETNSNQVDVTRYVLKVINNSIHVRPDIFMDAELPYVSDQDSPGVSAYRAQIGDVLHGYLVQSQLHEHILSDINNAGEQFRILVLKTNMTIPYTSVFIRLDCKYLSADAEQRLRARMAAAEQKPTH